MKYGGKKALLLSLTFLVTLLELLITVSWFVIECSRLLKILVVYG
jgi:hypothetical protein